MFDAVGKDVDQRISLTFSAGLAEIPRDLRCLRVPAKQRILSILMMLGFLSEDVMVCCPPCRWGPVLTAGEKRAGSQAQE
jgi:hypothetical protein